MLGGINTYAYVDGNPLSGIDPDGLLKIVLLPKTDPSYKPAMVAPDDPSTCIVISHGSNKTVNHMNARQLNKRITEAGCQPKQPVKLEACRTGEGENSIAEQLAKLRKSTVTAPDKQVWSIPPRLTIETPYSPVSSDPNSWLNNVPDLRNPGTWRTFDAKGPVTPTAPAEK